MHVDIRRHYEGTANVDCRAGKLHWLGALAIGATSVTAGVTNSAAAKHRMVAASRCLNSPYTVEHKPRAGSNPKMCQHYDFRLELLINPHILVLEDVDSR